MFKTFSPIMYEMKKLSDLCVVKNGSTTDSSKIKPIKCGYVLEPEWFSRGRTYETYNAPENTIVVHRIEDLSSEICIYKTTSKVFVSYYCYYLTDVKPEITTEYLLYTLKGKREEITSLPRFSDRVIIKSSLNNLQIEVPPLHLQNIEYLKRIYKARRRLEKLAFCYNLQDKIDEMRYRPDGDGYKEMRERNKGLWADI